jgi:hypothetical protein
MKPFSKNLCVKMWKCDSMRVSKCENCLPLLRVKISDFAKIWKFGRETSPDFGGWTYSENVKIYQLQSRITSRIKAIRLCKNIQNTWKHIIFHVKTSVAIWMENDEFSWVHTFLGEKWILFRHESSVSEFRRRSKFQCYHTIVY